MNNILCKYHPDNQIIFIIWNETTIKFVCDECMETNLQEGKQKQEKWKKLAIRKAFKEPEYFLNQFALNEKSKIVINALQNFSDVQLKDIIQKIELCIKEIQLILDKTVDELKYEVIKIIDDKDFLRSQLDKISYYSEFKELIESLNNSTQTVTHDVVKQAENKIQTIFLQMEKNSSNLNQEIQKVSEIPLIHRIKVFPGIEQLKLQIIQFKQLFTQIQLSQKDSNYKFREQFTQTEQLQDDNKFKEQFTQTEQSQIQQTVKSNQKMVPEEYFDYLMNKISLDANKQVKSTTLIFNQIKETLNQVNFWSCVKDKENLLMIFKSQSGNIFGAYTPLKWVYKNEEIYDSSYNSFLFSYTHKSIHQNKENCIALSLKRDKGPCFGYQNYQRYCSRDFDIYIEGDFQNGYSKLGNSYSRESSQDSETHLFGQKTPSIILCQIYQIIFKQ